MNQADLEDTYAALAQKIDEVGEEYSALFLAKLVLLLAHESGDAAVVRACINGAATSLLDAHEHA